MASVAGVRIAAMDVARTSYSPTSIALHWLVALLIVVAFSLGFTMTNLGISPLKLRMFNWHKWVGITVLGLAVWRSAWRLTHRPPDFLPMPVWRVRAAHGLHIALYALLFIQPLTGWIYSNYAGYPIVYLGLVPLPNLVARNRELAQVWLEVHRVSAMLLLVAAALHVAAAAKHQLIDRDGTLNRMWPWQRVSREEKTKCE